MNCRGLMVITLVVAFVNGTPSSSPISQEPSSTPSMDNKWEQVRKFVKNII